jgi:hypothetical protein
LNRWIVEGHARELRILESLFRAVIEIAINALLKASNAVLQSGHL